MIFRDSHLPSFFSMYSIRINLRVCLSLSWPTHHALSLTTHSFRALDLLGLITDWHDDEVALLCSVCCWSVIKTVDIYILTQVLSTITLTLTLDWKMHIPCTWNLKSDVQSTFLFLLMSWWNTFVNTTPNTDNNFSSMTAGTTCYLTIRNPNWLW